MSDAPKTRKENPWFVHVKKVRAMKKNKNVAYKDILVLAKKTYKPVAKKEPKKSKKVSGGSVKAQVEDLPISSIEKPNIKIKVTGGSGRGRGRPANLQPIIEDLPLGQQPVTPRVRPDKRKRPRQFTLTDQERFDEMMEQPIVKTVIKGGSKKKAPKKNNKK